MTTLKNVAVLILFTFFSINQILGKKKAEIDIDTIGDYETFDAEDRMHKAIMVVKEDLKFRESYSDLNELFNMTYRVFQYAEKESDSSIQRKENSKNVKALNIKDNARWANRQIEFKSCKVEEISEELNHRIRPTGKYLLLCALTESISGSTEFNVKDLFILNNKSMRGYGKSLDYTLTVYIIKVFTDKQAALQYKKWSTIRISGKIIKLKYSMNYGSKITVYIK